MASFKSVVKYTIAGNIMSPYPHIISYINVIDVKADGVQGSEIASIVSPDYSRIAEMAM